ncbi:diaminopimelate decarboxylase [Pseudactinotalea sp. HY160]|nr:diaminopimelate decarboxylase [Pseudactinotalea sp. HY160]
MPPAPLGAPWPAGAAVRAGVLELAGYSVTDLTETFATPSFLLDVADLRARAARFRDAFAAAFGRPVAVYYASKAFSSTAVLRWVHAEGLRVDCATGGELATALAAGIPGEDIGLHGNNKSAGEIATAIGAGVGRIVIDSLPEIELVARVAADLRASDVPVMVRVTTGIHAGGHEFIATAHEDQKFGLSLATGAARAALDAIAASPGLRLVGLHSHIGSQIMGSGGFAEAARAVLGLRAEAEAAGIEVPEIDLGGGYGIAYLPGEADLDPAVVAADLAGAVRAECAALGASVPEISIEPGRSIVGPAMVTVYTVGTVKPVTTEDGSQRLYVSVDGGMSDNIRTILYDASYTAMLANRVGGAETVRARVVGKHCESGDIVVEEVQLPADIRAGDLLAVPATGAYGRSLASNYNLVPRPGVVALGDGEPREIVRRETVADLLALDLG